MCTKRLLANLLYSEDATTLYFKPERFNAKEAPP